MENNDGPLTLGLPFIWTLPLCRRTLLFDDLKSTADERRAEAFNLFTDAARRSDNVGVDEIPTVEYLNWLLLFADDAIALYDDFTSLESGRGGGKMVGLIMILVSRYVRSRYPSNCTMMIVTGESISSHLAWRDCARIGFELAKKGQRHYTGCMIDVFVTCFEQIAALREEGFVVTACVPSAGVVSEFPQRHIDSYVMYKESVVPPVSFHEYLVVHTTS